jgi:hypothetical protein
MSAISDVMGVIRDAMRLTDEVKRVGDTLKSLSSELRDQDRRITRLEAQWDTAIQLNRIVAVRTPKQIKGK